MNGNQKLTKWFANLSQEHQDLFSEGLSLLAEAGKENKVHEPDPKEYQCVFLDRTRTLDYIENTVFFETGDLAEASHLIHSLFKITQIPLAVWQPRIQAFRDHVGEDIDFYDEDLKTRIKNSVLSDNGVIKVTKVNLTEEQQKSLRSDAKFIG